MGIYFKINTHVYVRQLCKEFFLINFSEEILRQNQEK